MTTTTKKPAAKTPATKPKSDRTSVPEMAPAASAQTAIDVLAQAHRQSVTEQQGHLEVAPSSLVVDTNVRTNIRLDLAFVESIREHGVISAITVRRDPLGQLLVVDGQRRTLAALKVDLAAVPVFVLEGVGDEETRVTMQYVANEQRAALSVREKAGAINDLLTLFGRSPRTTAKRLGVTEAEVAAAQALAGKETTAAALEQAPTVDLAQAAAIAEFDADPEIVTELTRIAVAEPDRFAHAVEEARDEIEVKQIIAAKVAQLREQGVTILEDSPRYNDPAVREINRLTDDPSAAGHPPAITPEDHASCPGHAAYVLAEELWNDNTYARAATAWFYCADWKGNGHHNRDAANTAGATSGPKSEDEKAEARKVRENNKSVAAAEKVRRRFITELLQRTKLPDLALQYTAVIVGSSSSWMLSDSAVPTLQREFAPEGLAPQQNPLKFLFAFALAVGEARLPGDYWRGSTALAAEHLRFLEPFGYTLTDVEAQFVKENLPKAGV